MRAKTASAGITPRLAAVALSTVFVAFLLGASSASAGQTRPFLETFGSAAQPTFASPNSALAVDPSNNDLLVVENGVEEIQTITLQGEPTGGSFTLSFEGQTTAPLPVSGTTAPTGRQVEEALAALSTIGRDSSLGFSNVSVVALGTLPATVTYRLTFGRVLEAEDVPQVSCDGSSLTGTAPACIAQTTQDGHSAALSRFKPNGEPDPFAALGSNAIDARSGPGGEPCAQEAASCDLTPQGKLRFGSTQFALLQVHIAVDNSGTATDGNIYVTQNLLGLLGVSQKISVVDTFASDGRYLGQITKAGTTSFEFVEGLAVDNAGALFVADSHKSKIYKYVSQGAPHNPLLNTDRVGTFSIVSSPSSLALGTGPTAGSLFATHFVGEVFKLAASNGAQQCEPGVKLGIGVGSGSWRIVTDPFDGHLVNVKPSNTIEDFSVSACPATKLGTTTTNKTITGIAAESTEGKLYVSEAEPRRISVYGHLVPIPDVITGGSTNIGTTSATVEGSVNPNGVPLEHCTFEWGKTQPPANGTYEHTEPCAESLAAIGSGQSPVEIHADLTSLEGESEYHYRFLAGNENGTVKGSDQSLQTLGKPTLAASWTSEAGFTEATLSAEIDPRSSPTTYRFEWGTEAGAYDHSSGDLALGSDASLHTVTRRLEGLAPGTTYHWRVLAESPAGLREGPDLNFTTFSLASPPRTDCPNQAFRVGPSANLTDCRAYELVSPARRSPRGDIVSGVNVAEYPAELNQSAADGERLTYTSGLAFGDAVSAPPTSQYIASRQAGAGWSTHAISPPRESQPIIGTASLKVEIEEKAFTADLCRSWLVHNAEPLLAENAIAHYVSLYGRENCGGAAGSYEAITAVEPTASTARITYVPELQGFSADGLRSVFRAEAKLTADAPDLGEYQVYEAGAGTLHFLCILPDGTPHEGSCTVGTESSGFGAGAEARTNSVLGAVSADARRVYWTAEEPGNNRLYLRENSDQDQSAMAAGECTEPEKACSYAVSGQNGAFWTAAKDGSAALYTEGQTLREFDAATKSSKTIADGVKGVAGASADLSIFYFVSGKALGGEGVEGEPNLYRSEEGALSLVATLSQEDTEGFSATVPFDPGSSFLTSHAARTTADGRHLLFASSASLTGYDNYDVETGKPDSEIYLYDSGAAGPVCISCNPSGARPAGRVVENSSGNTRGAAALLPAAPTQLYAPHAITEDGNRVFFNGFDALVPRDTNGKQDVYEWERAADAEACEELGAELYAESSGGCLSLVSSGESPQDSSFVDTSSANGARDVFFKTGSSLISEDPGSIDIYDARAGGGLPEAPRTPPACEGEACQSPVNPPDDPTPASAAFKGAGNVKEPAAKKCPQGKVRRQGRCASKHRKHTHRKHRKHTHNRTNHNRRAAK